MSVTHLTTTEGKDQFYPTPPELAAKMLEKVNEWRVSTILEPSASKGDLILAFSKKCVDEYRDHSIYSEYRRSLDVDACEIDPYLREVCKFNFSDQRADEELERISIAVETLQLWSERMLATGVIDAEQYNAHKNK